jgi:hypothetical protein
MENSGDDGLICRTYDNSPSAAAAAATEHDWSGWETWLRSHLDNEWKEIEQVVAMSLADERQRERREVREALAPLERELAELRGQVSALLTLLQGTKADVVTLSKKYC